MTESLGILKKVELRSVWESEAQHFTPWLAEEQNLSILSDTLKIDLELEATEKDVGLFRADILCKDTRTGDWVLIENQLERTDHIHLGQLLTYAAGLQAVSIVWVSANFTEEHRATLDWLNDITSDQFRFFGLEVELWRIGESQPAPKFNIVSKPNDWTRSIGAAAKRISDQPMSETQERYVQFWSGFRDHLLQIGSAIRPAKPPPENWTQYSVGRTGFSLSANFNTQEQWLKSELYIHGKLAKDYFRQLMEERESIERDFGDALDWQVLPDRIGTRIGVYKRNVDPMEPDQWPHHFAWMSDALQRLDRTFRGRVKTLAVSEPVQSS